MWIQRVVTSSTAESRTGGFLPYSETALVRVGWNRWFNPASSMVSKSRLPAFASAPPIARRFGLAATCMSIPPFTASTGHATFARVAAGS
jgi:hypothetical protein